MPSLKETTRPSQDVFETALEEHLQTRKPTPSELSTEDIREGVPFKRLQDLASRLELTQETLTHVLGTSERTLQRRRQQGRLSPSESDRFGRLEGLYKLALRAFDGDEEEARYWLTTPKRAFGGETPIEHLDTEPGTRAAQEMLIVIDQTMPA